MSTLNDSEEEVKALGMVWHPHKNQFVEEADYAAEIAETRRLLDEQMSESDRDWVEMRLPPTKDEEVFVDGMKLSGTLVLSGEEAVKARNTLEEAGYRSFKYSGPGEGTQVVKILPEERTYDEFIREAIYWYLRYVREEELPKLRKNRKLRD